MQTLKENEINYLVFPSTGSVTGIGEYIVLLKPTLTNNDLYSTFSTGSLEKINNRWRVIENYVTGSQTSDLGKLYAKAGQTYELELRYGQSPYYTWIEAYPEWTQAEGLWIQNGLSADMIRDNSILVNEDRVFVSGTVDPQRKIYITSNQEASFIIYTG